MDFVDYISKVAPEGETCLLVKQKPVGKEQHADGTIKAELFTSDKIHLSLAGYEVYASRLKPLLDASLKR